MIFTTDDTSDITRALFSVALICQVVTCTFGLSRFKMAIIFSVPISLTVCTWSNIPFVFGRFEFYFALLYIFYIEYVLVDRLCGLVVRVPGYRSDREVRVDFRRYQIFWEVVWLERCPLDLVSTIEDLLERKSSGSGLGNREYGHRDQSRWPRGTI
jgi:hypothetical protein